jgi:hypothetical protein
LKQPKKLFYSSLWNKTWLYTAYFFKFSANQSNFEDFLSVGKETTPTVPVPITSEKIMKKLIKQVGAGKFGAQIRKKYNRTSVFVIKQFTHKSQICFVVQMNGDYWIIQR